MENVITIPKSSTFEIQDKIFVYTVENGVAKSRSVTTIPLNNGKEYIVTDGLSVGDEIIAEGVGLLREGTPVVSKLK